MYQFPIGIIIDSLKMDTYSAIKTAASLGAQGIQMYATSGENSPRSLNANARRELFKYVRSNGMVFSAICGDLGKGFANKDENPFLIEQSKRIMDLALDLGTNIVTTHIGVIPSDKTSDKYKIMQEACFELGRYADSLNAHFAIETGPETSLVLKEFLDEINLKGMAVNFDPANLVMVTGDDPVKAVYNLKKYIVHTHAKDGIKLMDVAPEILYGEIEKQIQSATAFIERPLGEGNVDFKSYLNALDDIGYKGFVTIERECGDNPKKDIETAVRFLKKLYSDKYSEKVFEFSRVLGNSNEWVGNIQVIQVGETCLDKGACIEEHTQACHEITCVVSGGGFLKADNEEVYCGVGDVQIISKGVAHTITASSDTPLRYIHFAFDFFDYEPKTVADFYAECKHLVIHDNGDIRNILNMLVDEYFNDAVFTEVARIGLIQFLLVVVWRKVHLQTDRYDPVVIKEPMTSTVYDIIKYIDKNLFKQLTVSGIAEQFSYSSTYISRLFKAKTGLSLKEYIIAMKMNYAEKLLREGKSSLSEISGLVGYESVQSFSKQFKKITGKTPGDIRK